MPSQIPRKVTKEIRKELGLPRKSQPPFRWGFAMLCVGLASAPLLFTGYRMLPAAICVIGLALVPAVRAYEQRQREIALRVYTHGIEAVARVNAVEPGSPDRKDRSVRIKFWTKDKVSVEATVRNSHLTRRGLRPGEDVEILYREDVPTQCLIVDRVKRNVVDAIFDEDDE